MELEVVRVRLEVVSRELTQLLADLGGSLDAGTPTEDRASAGERAKPVRSRFGVTELDVHALERKGELICDQLRKGGLVSLAMRVRAHVDGDRAGGIHANQRCLEPGDHRHVSLAKLLCGVRGLLGVASQADPEPAAFSAGL